ncbi:hypothetical protein EJB05_41007, partial [Eragrostis curvula]
MNDVFADFVLDLLQLHQYLIIAQVHRATMVDGRDVVVKIQHDGVKEIILKDLKNAKSLIEWIAWAEPQYDFNPMIDEWRKETPKEMILTMKQEILLAQVLYLYASLCMYPLFVFAVYLLLKSVSSDVDVLIPEVIQSTDNVLILQYMDWTCLNDNDSLEAYGVDKQKKKMLKRLPVHTLIKYTSTTSLMAVLTLVLRFYLTWKIICHLGNFLVSKEPPHKPILLDFGLITHIKIYEAGISKDVFIMCRGLDIMWHCRQPLQRWGLNYGLTCLCKLWRLPRYSFASQLQQAKENIKALNDQKERNIKALHEKTKWNKKEERFNLFSCFWVDAFPGDAIIFMRVLNLLRGLSASLNVTIFYLDIMTPFAESTLLGSDLCLHFHQDYDAWTYTQQSVCAYKDGKVIIDTAAGMLGKYGPHPRPVQPDSLFPVFSVTKGITAGWYIGLWTKGDWKLKYEETVANIWPNIIENASGKKFQEVLEEAIDHRLHLDGELYLGIPPGVESRLAAGAIRSSGPELPSALLNNVAQMAAGIHVLFNTLNIRRAIIPAARALARYYAALATGGFIPPPHNANSKHYYTPRRREALQRRVEARCKGSKMGAKLTW